MSRGWDATERGYSAIQSTKPQTLGYELNDSRAGLAAYVVEKWHWWSEGANFPERRFSGLTRSSPDLSSTEGMMLGAAAFNKTLNRAPSTP